MTDQLKRILNFFCFILIDCCRFFFFKICFLANVVLSCVYCALVRTFVTELIDSAAYPLIGLDAL